MKIFFYILVFTYSFFSLGNEEGKSLFKACVQCHGVQGEGDREKRAPRIGGQYDWYILKALNEFKSGERKNPEMDPFIKELSLADFKNLANYISQIGKPSEK